MMLKTRFGVALFGMMMCLAGVAAAQVGVDTSHMDQIGELATHWQTELGPNINRLSGGAQTFMRLGEQWTKLKATAAALSVEQGAGPKFGPVSVSELSFTRFSGAVQSETSTAWCGKNAVVGFNDSGSFWQTGGFFPTGGNSLNGYAVSRDRGATFTDAGFPAVGPAGTMMSGDPVLACTGPSDFFYASLYEDSSAPALHVCPSGHAAGDSDISLSVSTDGGSTFGAPKAAIAKDACFHFLDKPWMTVDLANPTHIFVTYTDVDDSNFGAGSPGNICGGSNTNIRRTAIELVASTNGGSTWSAPTVVAQVCGAPFVQGSQVAVDQTGKIDVAWESFASNFFTREIDLASSNNSGATFSAPTKVSSVDPVGDGDFDFGIQGFIRDFEFPSLAIGRGTTNANHLYISWNDGDNRVNDAWAGLIKIATGLGDGKYGFSDVLFSFSNNAGATWSSPVAVNKKRGDHDNYQPGVATDRTGAIAVCWYDRRRDANNFLIDRFCGGSTDDGATWTNTKQTSVNYASVVNQDLIIAFDYMGDYDEITAQATGGQPSGFLGAFVATDKGSQSVKARKF
jgi:hypothetical protein